jgi:WS/DGAT/MGAT family acyltransferase
MTDTTAPDQPVEPHVSDVDAFTFRMERDPLLRSTIVAVAVLDRVPDWDHFRRRVERATRLAPTFRQKLVASPLGLASPRWIHDVDFDLDWHLRQVRVPDGGDLATVLQIARTAGMAAFDHDRPLWEITVVDGLPDGQAALVIKVHHALTDGIGGIQIANHVVDLDREPVEYDLPPAPRAVRHGPLVDLAETLGHDLLSVTHTGSRLIRGAPSAVAAAAADPLGIASEVLRTTGSLLRFVRPITTTRSPIMRQRRLQWHYDLFDVPLEPFKAAARRVDGTLNDAFMAAIAGGFREYHDRHGAMVGTLRMTMPISLRTEDDHEGGNTSPWSASRCPWPGHPEPDAEIGAICGPSAPSPRCCSATRWRRSSTCCRRPRWAGCSSTSTCWPATCPASRWRCSCRGPRCWASTRSAPPPAPRPTSP